MRPGVTAVVRSVHAVAAREIGADNAGAGTDVDDVGRRGRDGDCADRAGRFVVEERLPVVAVVARAPQAAVIEADVEERRTTGRRRERTRAAGAERADRAPAKRCTQIWSLRRGSRREEREKTEHDD